MTQRRRSSKAARRARQRRIRRIKLIGSGVVVALLVFLVCYLATSLKVNKVPKDVICDNIFIGDVNVSGMNEKEAKAAVEKKMAEYQEVKVTLAAEEAEGEVTLGDLGFHMKNVEKLVKEAVSYGKDGSVWSRSSKMKDLKEHKKVIKVTYAVDSEAVDKAIAEKMPKPQNGAQDATITRSNGAFVITDEVKGVTIDVAESVKVIDTYLNKEWSKGSGKIVLATKVEEPKITRAQLENVKDLLGSYTTVCGTGGGRVQNIVTGAKHISGTLLMPGEEYSANAAMEPYTTENGYTEAGSYENGEVVQSMGGGICQVSSTLYNAVIRSELEIVERAAHSMLVAYVEPSMDAAIAGDYKDLKFKNNTEFPVYIEGYVSGGKITFNVYGKETRPATRKVEYVSEVVSSTPAGEKFVASADPIGTIKKASSGYTGMKAKLWKVIYENGAEVDRKVMNNSTYGASAAVYHVGTASDNAEAAAIVNAAIASNDRQTIEAAVQKAQALIAGQQNQAATTPDIGAATP